MERVSGLEVRTKEFDGTVEDGEIGRDGDGHLDNLLGGEKVDEEKKEMKVRETLIPRYLWILLKENRFCDLNLSLIRD